MITPSTPLLVTFLLYIFAMIAVGFIAYRYTKNFSDYILGGRKLGSFVVALSAGASDMSGWLLMGLPGAIYLMGLSKIWIAVGLSIGAWCNWKWVAGRLRVYTERANNALTLPDYFTSRFEDKSRLLRIFSALVILVFFAIYASSGIVAGARLFESVFGLPYEVSVWAGAGATILYTLIGGFLAVSWTDTIQASLMIFALLAAPLTVIYFTGGLGETLNVIHAHSPAHFDLFRDISAIGVISLMAWGLGYVGQPHILARFMSASSYNEIAPARRISITWMVLCLLGATAVGFFGVAYFDTHPVPQALADNSERIFLDLSLLLFDPWFAGLLLSAILAAIMSTLSCQLLVCSSALTEDFYKAFLRKDASQKELVWIGRLCVFLVALLAIYLARDPNNSVLDLVQYAWSGFGAALGPVVVGSLIWKRMTRNGALAGMVLGSATVILWKNASFIPADIAQLNEILPGFLLASVAIVLVSLLDKAPSASIQGLFDQVHQEIDEYEAKKA